MNRYKESMLKRYKIFKMPSKIKSLLKVSSTIIPPNQDQWDEDEEEIVDFFSQLEKSIVKFQEIKSEDDHSGVQKARKIKYSPLKNPSSHSKSKSPKNCIFTKKKFILTFDIFFVKTQFLPKFHEKI